jgi:SAM-dependent methyltransferase
MSDIAQSETQRSFFERLPKHLRCLLSTPLKALYGNTDRFLTPEENDRLTYNNKYTKVLSHAVGDILQEHITSNNVHRPQILEIAAVNGILAQDLQLRGFTVTVVDLDRIILDSIKQMSSSVQTVASDINNKLPFPDLIFDGATTLMANRYIADPLHFLYEIHRVLKPHGVFVWPILKGEQLAWEARAGIAAPTTPEALVEAAKQKGFSTATIVDKNYETNNLQSEKPIIATLKIVVLIS